MGSMGSSSFAQRQPTGPGRVADDDSTYATLETTVRMPTWRMTHQKTSPQQRKCCRSTVELRANTWTGAGVFAEASVELR
jgi:hypothetical protein